MEVLQMKFKTEITLYKAEDGDWSLAKGAWRGWCLCKEITDHVDLPKSVDKIFIKFSKRASDNNYLMISENDPSYFGVVYGLAEHRNKDGSLVWMLSQSQKEMKKAIKAGYSYVDIYYE